MENQEKKHKRRVRYSGAYPKSYNNNSDYLKKAQKYGQITG